MDKVHKYTRAGVKWTPAKNLPLKEQGGSKLKEKRWERWKDNKKLVQKVDHQFEQNYTE